MDEPRIAKIAAGWAAYGDGWAVHARTPEEARARFEAAQARHQEIDARPLPEEREQQELKAA